MHEENDGLRAQKRPLPGTWPAPLPEVAGPQAAVTVGYLAAGAPSLAVVLVSDMMHDDATVQFLLQQSLLARARAEEAEVVKQLEVVLAEAEDKLFVALEEFRVSPSRPSWNSLSPALKAAVQWHVAVDRVRKRKRKGRRRKRRRRTTAWYRLFASLVSVVCTPLSASSGSRHST